MVMPYTHWVCLSVFIEIYDLLRGMLNKFMTRLYHTKTILYIIIIGLEAQPPPNIILLLHRHSGGDNDSNNNNNCCCCCCCCYYYIIILAESIVPNYAFTG